MKVYQLDSIDKLTILPKNIHDILVFDPRWEENEIMRKIYGGILIYGIKLELKHIPALVHYQIIKCTDPITWPIYWTEMEEHFSKIAHSTNLWEQLYYIMYGHNYDIPTLSPEINKLIMDYM